LSVTQDGRIKRNSLKRKSAPRPATAPAAEGTVDLRWDPRTLGLDYRSRIVDPAQGTSPRAATPQRPPPLLPRRQPGSLPSGPTDFVGRETIQALGIPGGPSPTLRQPPSTTGELTCGRGRDYVRRTINHLRLELAASSQAVPK
jgi:hypothetical protein